MLKVNKTILQRYSYNDHKASIINPGPGVLLLAADETGFDTAQCLAKKIGDSFSSECSQNSLTFLVSVEIDLRFQK